MGKKVSKLLLFISLVFTSITWAQDVDSDQIEEAEDITLRDPNLSLKYQKGAFLLYDCVDKHWVCTAKPEFLSCKESRDIAIKDQSSTRPCVPIREFSSDQACQNHQRTLVDSAMRTRFCNGTVEY